VEGLLHSQVSQLLWAAQGKTHPSGYLTAPSAGALYTLGVYLVVGMVEGLPVGWRYVYMETGSVAQNNYFQAENLDLGTVLIGAFQDDQVVLAIGISDEETPVGIMPVGWKLISFRQPSGSEVALAGDGRGPGARINRSLARFPNRADHHL
jgi:hypothetical protein